MDRSPYLGTRAMAWALLATVLPLAAARAQTFPTVPVNLSGTSHAEIPAIAIGPSGDINVIWFDAGAILFRRSQAGGGAFSSSMVVTTTNLPSQPLQPQIAINAAGVYVAWAGINNSGGGDIFFSSLVNGTNSWTSPVNVSNGNGISGTSAPVPRIAADPSGGVDIAWGQNGAWFRRSPDGISFSPPVPLTSTAMAKQSPRMAINSQGHVLVVWENAASCPTITFARSTDKGGHFAPYSVDDTLTLSDGSKVTGCASDVQIAIGAGNSIWLLWANDSPIQDLIITYAIDQDPFTQPSTSTSFPEAEFENLSGTASHTPQMAIDANGNLSVVWIGDDQLNDPTHEVVYFDRSTDPEKGGTFCGGPNDPGCKTPPKLTSAPPSGSKAPASPQIAVEPSGAIDVLWQQASATNPNNAYDIVVAHSADGASFKQFTLDNSPTITNDTAQLAVDGSGAVYAVWSGNSGSGADIFLSGDSTALTQFVVSGLTASISPASATISVGGSATFTVSLSSTNGSSGSVTLTCAGAPSGVSCSSGLLVTVPGNGILSVSVSAKPSASAAWRWPGVPASPSAFTRLTTALWAIGIVILVAALIISKLKVTRTQLSYRAGPIGISHQVGAFARPVALMLLLTAVATGLVSCSGSTNGRGGGGGGSITFPLTVQARSSSASANLQTISITVP